MPNSTIQSRPIAAHETAGKGLCEFSPPSATFAHRCALQLNRDGALAIGQMMFTPPPFPHYQSPVDFMLLKFPLCFVFPINVKVGKCLVCTCEEYRVEQNYS